VAKPAARSQRVFKTAWFAKAAGKATITDSALCKAIQQVMQGQCDDLGGGVYKKRLSKNLTRSIILAKGGQYWIYAYLFAKKDRTNIDNDELMEFRKIAKAYETVSEERLAELLKGKDWMEICDEDEA
jgi:hypothetical protein